MLEFAVNYKFQLRGKNLFCGGINLISVPDIISFILNCDPMNYFLLNFQENAIRVSRIKENISLQKLGTSSLNDAKRNGRERVLPGCGFV